MPSIAVRSNVIEVIQTAGRAKELYLRLVKSAVEEVLLVFPTTNAFIRQGDIGAIQLAKEAANKRNAKVRILLPADKLTEQKVQDLKQQNQRNIDIRYIEQMEAKATILVVDRKASLVMEIRDDSKESFIEAIGLSTYSNSEAGVLSYVAIFENLWKQSELYQEIKESNEKLEINGKLLNEFIHIAAHELRNPIQPILVLSQIVKTKITQKEKGEEVNIDEVCSLLDVVIRNARKLHRLTDDVLDITRIETNSLHLKKETLNLKEVIQLSVDDYISQNNIAKKNDSNNYYRNIKLSSFPSISKEEKQQNADLFLIGADMGRISQVVSNLLSNAVKFTNECDTIFVNLEEKDTDSGREFIVSIKDTGTGIDPEILPRLFTKFATKSDRGTGLGLFISKSIVEAHGGKIWAKNNSDGKGATFAFSLPLIIRQDHHPQESRDISTTTTMLNDTEERIKKKYDDNSRSYYNSHKTKKKRIFLVDDDYDHTVTFKVGLELAGFEVDAYNDSATALSNFKADHYDLLLIDIKMPKVDGFELYEKISKIDDEVKVWFITAYEIYSKVTKEVSSRASKEEMILDRFIQKPIEINNLVKQVKSELS